MQLLLPIQSLFPFLSFFIMFIVAANAQQQQQDESVNPQRIYYANAISPTPREHRLLVDLYSGRPKPEDLAQIFNDNSLTRTQTQQTITFPRQWSEWSQCDAMCTRKRYRACRKRRQQTTRPRQQQQPNSATVVDLEENLLSRRNDKQKEGACTHTGIQYQVQACSDCLPPAAALKAIDYESEASTFIRNLVFTEWTRWSACSQSSCVQVRLRVCTMEAICGRRVLVQHRQCGCSNAAVEENNNIDETNNLAPTSDGDGESASATRRIGFARSVGGKSPTSPNRTDPAVGESVLSQDMDTRVRMAMQAAAAAAASRDEPFMQESASTVVENMLRSEAALNSGGDTTSHNTNNDGSSAQRVPVLSHDKPAMLADFALQPQRPVVVTAEVSSGSEPSSDSSSKRVTDNQTVSNAIIIDDGTVHQSATTTNAFETFVHGFGATKELNITCGVPRTNAMFRIMGGTPALKGAWPWQVVLLDARFDHYCGGTLISDQWVLTAAHCVKRKMYAIVGEHHLAEDEDSEQIFFVKAALMHRDFNLYSIDADIALLKLSRRVVVNGHVMPACLPARGQELPPGALCKVLGWGKRSSSDVAGSEILRQADMPVVETRLCKKRFSEFPIQETMICAGNPLGRIDTCSGDSGGPLLCRPPPDASALNDEDDENEVPISLPIMSASDNVLYESLLLQNASSTKRNEPSPRGNKPWTIFGITSFGESCTYRGKLGVYTKVSKYIDWVLNIVKNYENRK